MEIKKFSEINLKDPFFESLKADYPEFESWFNKKSRSNSGAFVEYDKENNILDFLYLKVENDTIDDVIPILPAAKRLKVGTFKITARGTHRGERFIKKIMDVAMVENVKEIYVTIFSRHAFLIRLLSEYGFVEKAIKHHELADEKVLIKDMKTNTGNIIKDYPRIDCSTAKYVLSIYPEYHTRLFPDSILNNESRYDLIKDVSYTNSIYKIYISFMQGTEFLKTNDLILIYRSTPGGGAYYRSVVSAVCTVQEVKTKKDFDNESTYLDYCKAYSIFSEDELKEYYRKNSMVVIKMIYNFALPKRVNNAAMQEAGIHPHYWGFFPLTSEQFNQLMKLGGANENYIID
jgi:hypothetical protein